MWPFKTNKLPDMSIQPRKKLPKLVAEGRFDNTIPNNVMLYDATKVKAKNLSDGMKTILWQETRDSIISGREVSRMIRNAPEMSIVRVPARSLLASNRINNPLPGGN
jgi:hypothetical protein